jgi:hypothetical protein
MSPVSRRPSTMPDVDPRAGVIQVIRSTLAAPIWRAVTRLATYSRCSHLVVREPGPHRTPGASTR